MKTMQQDIHQLPYTLLTLILTCKNESLDVVHSRNLEENLQKYI